MGIIFIIINIISIPVCVVICENKGRTSWKGFLAGLFLSWIGVIICACLSDRKNE